MADPDDMILPLLREMRAENAARHGESLEKFASVEARLDKMEETLNTFRHALSADSLLSKLVTGEFEERIEAVEALEKRVSLLERKLQELESLK